MAHQRTDIRNYVVAQLVAANTVAGANVKPMRYIPQRGHALPAISVYTADEQSEELGSAPRSIMRTLKLSVVGWVKQGANPEDAADNIAWQIEQVMHRDPYFGGIITDSWLVDTQVEMAEVGDQPVAVAALTFEVSYITNAPETPNGPLLDFGGANVTYNLDEAQADDRDRAHDEVDL